MDRAEKLKKQIETEKRLGKYHEQLHITENSTGHSYNSVLGRFLDGQVTVVEVEDPYIRAAHQVRGWQRIGRINWIWVILDRFGDLQLIFDIFWLHDHSLACSCQLLGITTLTETPQIFSLVLTNLGVSNFFS